MFFFSIIKIIWIWHLLSASIEPQPAIIISLDSGGSDVSVRMHAGRTRSLNSTSPSNSTRAMSFFLVVIEYFGWRIVLCNTPKFHRLKHFMLEKIWLQLKTEIAVKMHTTMFLSIGSAPSSSECSETFPIRTITGFRRSLMQWAAVTTKCSEIKLPPQSKS